MCIFLVLACLSTYVASTTVQPARLKGCGGDKLKDVVRCMINSEFNQRKDYKGCVFDCYNNNKCVMTMFGIDDSNYRNGGGNFSTGDHDGGHADSNDRHDDGDHHGHDGHNMYEDESCYNLTNPFEKYEDDDRLESCYESFKTNTTNLVLSYVKKAIKNFEVPNLNDTFNNATMETVMTEMQNKMMKMMNDSRKFTNTTCSQQGLNECLKKCVQPQDRCTAERTCAQRQTTCDFELTKKLYMQNGKYVINSQFPRLKKSFYACLGVRESDYPVTQKHVKCFKSMLLQEYHDECVSTDQNRSVSGIPPRMVSVMPPTKGVTLNPTMIRNAISSSGYTMPTKTIFNVTVSKSSTKVTVRP